MRFPRLPPLQPGSGSAKEPHGGGGRGGTAGGALPPRSVVCTLRDSATRRRRRSRPYSSPDSSSGPRPGRLHPRRFRRGGGGSSSRSVSLIANPWSSSSSSSRPQSSDDAGDGSRTPRILSHQESSFTSGRRPRGASGPRADPRRRSQRRRVPARRARSSTSPLESSPKNFGNRKNPTTTRNMEIPFQSHSSIPSFTSTSQSFISSAASAPFPSFSATHPIFSPISKWSYSWDAVKMTANHLPRVRFATMWVPARLNHASSRRRDPSPARARRTGRPRPNIRFHQPPPSGAPSGPCPTRPWARAKYRTRSSRLRAAIGS